MAMSSTLIFYAIVIFSSSLNQQAISSDDEDFGAASLCMNNSTKGNPLYDNYESSVISLLSDLPHEPIPPIPRFRNTSSGAGKGKAYSSYICWGNVSPKLCEKCIVYATKIFANTQDFYQDCFGFGYYKDSGICLVHYSNHSVSAYMKGYVMSMGGIGGKVAKYKEYNQTLSTTIERLIKEASIGNWTRTNLESRIVPVMGSDHEKIHILVQCIPVLSAKNCSSCLRELYDYVPTRCDGTQGGVVVHANCMIKFNNQSFIGAAYRTSNVNYIHILLVLLVSVYFVICI